MELRLSSANDAALDIIADAIRDVDGARRWNFHLLIDPALVDPLPKLGCGERQRTRIPIDPTLISEAHCPYMVPIREVGRDPLIDAALARAIREIEGDSSFPAGSRSVCAFIASKESAIEMARRLARSAITYCDGERKLFRFWDPRVMDLLRQFISFDEISHLIIPADRWCWIARGGRAEVLVLDDVPRETMGHDALDTRRFKHFGRINKVLDALDLDATSYRNIDCTRIDRDIRDGERRWKLQSDYEMVSYALHSYLVGKNFDDDIEVKRHMEAAVQNGNSPVMALESLDEQFWMAIAERKGHQGH